MARKYHSLIQRIDGRWYPQFGDYDRECVAEERRGMIEGFPGEKAANLKIITTGPKQADIEAAIAKLNS